MALKVTIRIDTMTTDAGECPMCQFDSLRRFTAYRITTHGVTTLFDQTHCGRCVNDMREAL